MFCAGNKEDSISEISPTVIHEIALGPDVVRKHYDPHSCALGCQKKFRARAAGVRRVFGVGMQYCSIVVIVGFKSHFMARSLITQAILADGAQSFNLHSLNACVFAPYCELGLTETGIRD